MTSRVVSVGLLSSYVKQLLETDDLLSDIWVEGEVSDVFVSRAGHIYFTLRDTDSQLKCVLFKGHAQRQRVVPAIGEQFAIHGNVSYYEASGALQFYVDVVEHAGAGLLALQFEQLRQRLESEGLFDESRKRALPAYPKVIAVVTSEQGSVWQDIQTVLRRRYPLAHLLLSPAPVQGPNAPDGVVRALKVIQDDGRADIAIVARGGGSAEDLACFNDERIARAVFASRIPVVSAIGHETDWTIIDFVADLRAPTPSAAAEMCTPSIDALGIEIRRLRRVARDGWASASRTRRESIVAIDRRLERQTPASNIARTRDELARTTTSLVAQRSTILDSRRGVVRPLGMKVALQKEDVARSRRALLEPLRLSLSAAVRLELTARRGKIETSGAVLGVLDPMAELRRGYAVLSDDRGRILSSVAQLAAGMRVTARLADGNATATVERVDALPGVRHNG